MFEETYYRNLSNMVIAHKGGKFAIFNSSTSEFLTPHKYDRIILSESGYHVGCICAKMDTSVIVCSEVISSEGEITSFEDLIIGYRNGFTKFGVAIAYRPSTGGSLLVDHKGNPLTKEYKVISSMSCCEELPPYYLAKIDIENEIYEYYNARGELIEAEFETFVQMIKLLEKTGPCILNNAPYDFFFISDNFIKILNAVNDYVEESLTLPKFKGKESLVIGEFCQTVKFLSNMAEVCKPQPSPFFPKNYTTPPRSFIKVRIEQNVIKKQEDKLLNKILS